MGGHSIKNPRNGTGKYAGVLIKEQQIKGCLKVSSPGTTGINHNLQDKSWHEPGLSEAYEDDPSEIPQTQPSLHEPF